MKLIMILYLDWEQQLVEYLADEQIVTQCFSHLHDSYNSSIDLILTILVNSFFRCLLLLVLK